MSRHEGRSVGECFVAAQKIAEGVPHKNLLDVLGRREPPNQFEWILHRAIERWIDAAAHVAARVERHRFEQRLPGHAIHIEVFLADVASGSTTISSVRKRPK